MCNQNTFYRYGHEGWRLWLATFCNAVSCFVSRAKEREFLFLSLKIVLILCIFEFQVHFQLQNYFLNTPIFLRFKLKNRIRNEQNVFIYLSKCGYLCGAFILQKLWKIENTKKKAVFSYVTKSTSYGIKLFMFKVFLPIRVIKIDSWWNSFTPFFPKQHFWNYVKWHSEESWWTKQWDLITSKQNKNPLMLLIDEMEKLSDCPDTPPHCKVHAVFLHPHGLWRHAEHVSDFCFQTV